ncbi:hypothetical protein O0L34_g9126 [Tuta absoluta]|nr:hypothetical protein O0L34_g9126 [Tuta absoluta]KAJ2945069.1 hypothetical protein O0L34_g9126 [Tuta absoluta]KAJ2945070.1 hypothetical protein O0L34_g9126 [Tuta absoluta]KAJ2945071.1 hypothetical protein O0L34_g9126 [Tuta absoluta]
MLIEQRKAGNMEKKEKPRKLPSKRILQQDNSAEEDTVSLENEHHVAETIIEQEKRQTEELEQQIRSLEERLVQGGGGGKDLINNLNESQMMLEQKNMEIAERKKREVEMQQKIDLEEETTAIVTNTFTTLQQEVDHKTQRLKKCLQKYACLREEMVELREAHDSERREHEELQATLIAELRRKLLLADSFVPQAGRAAVLRLRYNEDTDTWEMPEQCNAEPLTERPIACGARRPMCATALASRDPRHRAENILDLQLLPLPTTTRAHLPPPTRQRQVAEAPVKKEPDIEPAAATSVAPSRRAQHAVRRPTTAHHRVGTAAAGR